MTFNISLNKILPLAMWKAKNVQICSQEAYLPWSTVHKMQSNTSVSVKSLVSALTSDQMQLWYAFGFFTQYQQLAQHIDRNRSWMPFQRDSEFSQNPNQSFIGYVYKNSLKSQLSFRINVRKANLNYIYIFICLSHFLAELFSTPLRQRYCCNIAGHHNLPGEKFTQNTKNINKKELKRNWLQNVGQIFQKHVKTFNMYSIFIYAALLMARGTTYPKVSNIESFWLLAFLASSSDHWGRSFYSNN